MVGLYNSHASSLADKAVYGDVSILQHINPSAWSSLLRTFAQVVYFIPLFPILTVTRQITRL